MDLGLESHIFHSKNDKIYLLPGVQICWGVSEAWVVSFHTYNKGNGIILQGKSVSKYLEPIGGPGKTVEIKKSKFENRKYHRGKRVGV